MRTVAQSVAHLTQTRENTPYHTTSHFPGHLPGTHSMKPRTEKHSETMMRFFTPNLYLRFNSADEKEADQAAEEWETALSQYREHLVGIRQQMPFHARALTELCLHDAELLAYEQAIESHFPREAYSREMSPFWSAMAIVSVKHNTKILSLIYLLWDSTREFPSTTDWPFSGLSTYWLYDEFDVGPRQPDGFLHRILFSDGRVLEIPFLSAFVHTLPQSPQEEGSDIRQIA